MDSICGLCPSVAGGKTFEVNFAGKGPVDMGLKLNISHQYIIVHADVFPNFQQNAVVSTHNIVILSHTMPAPLCFGLVLVLGFILVQAFIEAIISALAHLFHL